MTDEQIFCEILGLFRSKQLIDGVYALHSLEEQYPETHRLVRLALVDYFLIEETDNELATYAFSILFGGA